MHMLNFALGIARYKPEVFLRAAENSTSRLVNVLSLKMPKQESKLLIGLGWEDNKLPDP